MTVLELRDRLITDGIDSVKRHEIRPERIRGGIAGFNLCSELSTPQAFQRVLQQRHAEERRMISEHYAAKSGESKITDYWEYRIATVQVEFRLGSSGGRLGGWWYVQCSGGITRQSDFKRNRMKFVIDRKRWWRGKGSNDSRLLIPTTGEMCCLGFRQLATGLQPSDISDMGNPASVVENGDLPCSLRIAVPLSAISFRSISRISRPACVPVSRYIGDEVEFVG